MSVCHFPGVCLGFFATLIANCVRWSVSVRVDGSDAVDTIADKYHDSS